MKQGLQLRLSQQLAMTPQLQQAIRLLQLSTLELQQELQQALESNPLLEQTDLHDEVEAKEVEDRESLDTVDALEQKEMPDELPLDASWDEIYTAGTPSGNGVDYQDDELPVYQGETTQTLQDYLMWQVELHSVFLIGYVRPVVYAGLTAGWIKTLCTSRQCGAPP